MIGIMTAQPRIPHTRSNLPLTPWLQPGGLAADLDRAVSTASPPAVQTFETVNSDLVPVCTGLKPAEATVLNKE
jgi:hypothetical protein